MLLDRLPSQRRDRRRRRRIREAFRSGRNFSAWIGLVPKQHSSGGKDGLGNISKQGDRIFECAVLTGTFLMLVYQAGRTQMCCVNSERTRLTSSSLIVWPMPG